ncbi:hypothetical protein [Nostoc sp.]|uniref:hypothetical protein n=1 Tax=Nostoc sp. TaxID=1180 RepID=UPI002FF52013
MVDFLTQRYGEVRAEERREFEVRYYAIANYSSFYLDHTLALFFATLCETKIDVVHLPKNGCNVLLSFLSLRLCASA